MNNFLHRITEILEENISDEKFGVSELAHAIGMSRSSLLRKVKSQAKISASQFIRQYRLKRAKEILQDSSSTVSEVSFQVGFSSTSYFIKCFHDYYGFTPGEVGKPTQSHQLAAIMFTDIEGYTALMQRDESRAIVFRKRHREVFNSVTKKFNGRILQYYGDGTLSTFPSAIDAVHCGIEMQSAFLKDPRIPVRMGIHSGDVIFTEEEIIGDGVNVASRIESLASSGSVFISEKVYDEVKNQSGIQTTSMGVFSLKNVDKPLEVFAIANPGLVIPEKDQVSEKVKADTEDDPVRGKRGWVKWVIIIFAAILMGYFAYDTEFFGVARQSTPQPDLIAGKKSVAVLPFINDSNDSTNVYIINGLMESTLNYLQKIEGLRVISRTSVEKYRNNPKTIPEISKELNVNYFVEGSGQKIGDQILLNVQLIEASTDQHLWSEQYNREAKDIFKLQMEIAKTIVDRIEVILTPEEEKRMNEIPTDDPVAYDSFLKGLNLMYDRTRENLEHAITYFKSAIEQDNEFARAYAAIAMAYYHLDEFQADKKHASEINYYSDQAILLDSDLPQSLIAKALFYMSNKEYPLAVSFFEKALDYNPNNSLALVYLVDLYVNYIPNTQKYLEYALRGLEIDVGAYDSLTTSFIYLHISNAFIQSGFEDEAEKYINKSLGYNDENLYSEYTKAYILYAKNRDLEHTKDLLIKALAKDTTRLDIMQEVGKMYYYLRDYENAYHYYKKFTDIREALNLDIYKSENSKIGFVFSKMGLNAESERYFDEFKQYLEIDQTIYKDLSMGAYYSYLGDTKKAIERLRLFAQQDNYHYWIVLFLKIEPLLDNIKDLPEFQKISREIETKFWDYHKQIRSSLEEKGLIRSIH